MRSDGFGLLGFQLRVYRLGKSHMGEALAVIHKLKVAPVKSDPEIGGRYKA